MASGWTAGYGDQQLLDRQRFQNPSAWLDREVRQRRRCTGIGELGYGYARPREPAAARQEQPFYIMEPSFTSGKLIARKYDLETGGVYATETTRTDPYHYPNALGVKEEFHFEDRRMRSACTDVNQKPKEAPRKLDQQLREAVSDAEVTEQLRAMRAEKRVTVDPNSLAVLQDKNIRPTKEHLRQLNVDLSCLVLRSNERATDDVVRTGETGSARRERAAMQTAHNAAIAGGEAAKLANDRQAAGDFMRAKGGNMYGKWGWAVTRPKPSTPPGAKQLEADLCQSKSMSALLGGPSMLGGHVGTRSTSCLMTMAPTSTFHGTANDGKHTRSFGASAWDGRMRGGKAAREGIAGTFPNKQVRPTFGQL